MDLKTSFFGYDMEIVLGRFERLRKILDQIDERKINKDTALNLFDAITAEPIRRRLTGFNRKSVDAAFASIREQLVNYQPQR
ncbi:MAG: hypothetical protein J6I55_00520 [Ruminococcus sp.]|jgi:hypothetical protein|nr:hypothetical protein [Ruminococcus sp.]HAE52547.1 hypothetical protein [Ruminococcus sp.]